MYSSTALIKYLRLYSLLYIGPEEGVRNDAAQAESNACIELLLLFCLEGWAIYAQIPCALVGTRLRYIFIRTAHAAHMRT